MKKWRVVVETDNGGVRYRWPRAGSLDEASDKVRAKIPVEWRIVSVEEVPIDEYEGRCTECGDPGHKASNCDMEG